MSDVTDPNAPEEIFVDQSDSFSAISSVLGFLAPETVEPPAGESDPAPGAPSPGAGQPEPAGEGAPAPADLGSPPDPGDAGQRDLAPSGDSAPAVEDGAQLVEFTTLEPKLGEMLTSFEAKTTERFELESLAEIKEEHAKYFAVLNEHPRYLINTQVPKIGGEEGEMETLRDAEDAQNYQNVLKQELFADLRRRVEQRREEAAPEMERVTASIQLFQNNPDLLPGSKEFDKELADQFAALAKGFEHRVDGKLLGYTVPVQSLVTQVRQQLTARRAAAPAPAPAAPTAQQQRAAEQQRNEQGQFAQPQAGIPSTAGGAPGKGVNDDIADFYDAINSGRGLIV